MTTAAYEKQVQRVRKAALEDSANARDIAKDYPPPGDLEARAACGEDLKLFLEWYFPAAFPLPWSADHLRAIARLEDVIRAGGLFSLAMPRGAGKTTLFVRAAIWALLYGHRRFVSLVAATEDHATSILSHVKAELTFNEGLGRDHRQACYAIRRLEGTGRKAVGQLFDGEPTRITWGADRLTLPVMPDRMKNGTVVCDGTNVSGSCVTVAGLTGAIRGQSATLPTGQIIRPELVLLDDPQTRESAMSPSQSASREAIIKGDVLGMAGPGRRIAALMACTVIRRGDMADLMLDRERNPAWSGQKAKMVYSFPSNEKLWEEYRRLWGEGLKADRGISEATEFYRSHRAEMDEGARVAWPERHYPDELSGLQHAVNLRLHDEEAFWSEYQNEPLDPRDSRPDQLTADQIAAKLNRIPRGSVPTAANRLTAFIDVHGPAHYWMVTAWEDDFSGYVIDYGTYPDQKRPYFALRELRATLEGEWPMDGTEARIYKGLEAAVALILGREWRRDDGAEMRVERCLIDANWQTDTVFKFARHNAHASIITPSHGKFIGASGRPIREWTMQPGSRRGEGWMIPGVKGRRAVRYAIMDVNHWKTFVHSRLAVPMGGRGSLSLFGSKAEEHRLLADHLTAEYPIPVEGRGRRLDEWKKLPTGDPDNHWLDCLVGCAVAASIQGVKLAEARPDLSPRPAAGAGGPRTIAQAQQQRRVLGGRKIG